MSQKQTQSNFYRARQKLLRKHMAEFDLDALFTLNPANQRWLSGWTAVFDSEPAHLALITKRAAYLHTDSRYSEAMSKKNKEGLWRISSEPLGHFAFMQKVLAKKRKQELRLGYESDIRLDLYKKLKKECSSLKLVETKGVFNRLRAVKDKEEIGLLRKAQRITDAAFADLITWIKPGMRELEIANRLDFVLRDKGGEELAFSTIVASGPRAALPHARPTARRIKRGDMLVLDFGARYHDYAADMTRTLSIGKARDRQRQLYHAVLAAQTAAKQGIRAGITGKDAYDLANEVLKKEQLSKAFTHSLGHGVGIEVHELPALSPLNTKPLVAGNIVTVEPGVYLPGYGGVRIEDFGLVETKGFSSFTCSPHELIEITDTP